MFICAANILENASVHVCRLCLVEEEDLVYLFNPKGYQGFQLWKLIEELLQEEVSKEDGMPWTVCKGCVSKLKEFKHFKSTCIQSKISFLSMMVNRGSEFIIKDEDNADESLSEAETHDQDILPKDDSSCMGVSSDASLADPLTLIDIKDDTDAVESCSEAGTCNQKNHQEYGSLDVQVSTVLCLPLVKEELCWDKEEVGPRESLAREETHGGENLAEDETRVTSISHRISEPQLMDNMALIDTEDIESTRSLELQDDEEDYNYRLILDSSSEDENADNVQSCGDKEEDDSGSQSLTREEAQGVKAIPEDESRLTSVSKVVIVPSLVENVSCLAPRPPSWFCREPTKTILKRTTCQTSRKDYDEVEVVDIVKEETPVLAADEDYTREVTVSRKEMDSGHGEKAKVKEEVTSSESLSEAENNRSEENPHESESSNDDDSSVENSPLEMDDLVDGCSIAGGSTRMCEDIVSELRDGRNKNITKKFERNSSLSAFPEEHSLGIVKKCSAKKAESLKSGDCITSAQTLNDMMPSERLHLDSHKKQLAGSTAFICDQCGVKYTDKKMLLIHVEGHISRNRPLRIVKPSLKCSQSRVTGIQSSKQFTCKMCGMEFKFKSLLTNHYVVHSNLKPFKCETCGNVFKRKGALLRHSKIHLDSKLLNCDSCGKGFTSMSELARHLVIHSGLRPFKCDKCGKGFARKSGRDNHSLIHSGLRPYKCDTCRRGFRRKTELCSHLVVHSGLRPYKCDTCGRGFKRKTDLCFHLVVHSGLRPYKCDTCGKGFKRKTDLCFHLVMHSSWRPYKCGTCGKGFARKFDVDRHSVMHSSLRPFKCDTCGKVFARKTYLKQHSVMHSSLRPFKCETCGKKFKRRIDLRRHSIIHS